MRALAAPTVVLFAACVFGAAACSTEGTGGDLGGDSEAGTGGSDETGDDLGAAGAGSGGESASGGSSAASGGGPAGSGASPGLPSVPSERLKVDGGSFPMGRSDDGPDACPAEQTCAPGEGPEHTATVSTFWLDRFEVTVERLRPFYEAYPLPLPSDEDGAHPSILGSGWRSEFAADLPDSQAELLVQLSCGDAATFTASAGTGEDRPVGCVSWPIAFLYCLQVGGRLPTEAEWERAAAGGDENRLYPWGDEAPNAERAAFFPSELTDVGAHAQGKGRYGHEDLAGSVWEWTLDWLDTNWYSGSGAPCTDCARVSSGTHRALRGGAYSFEAVALRAAVRSGELPDATQPSIGFRCAYDSAD